MSSQQLLSYASIGIIFLSAMWVLRDAKHIGLEKGRFNGLGNMGPWGWCLACLFLWIIAFPFYLFKRREFLLSNTETKGSIRAVSAVGFSVFAVELIVIGVLLFGSPKESTQQLQTQVRESIINNFGKNPKLADIRVGTLRLVHDSGNMYRGLLQVSSGGKATNLEVHVTYDGRRFMWRIVGSRSSNLRAAAPAKFTATDAPSGVHRIGQEFSVGPFQVKVLDATVANSIGVSGDGDHIVAPTGTRYLMVRYEYENVKTSPHLTPDVRLVYMGAKPITYDPDMEATTDYQIQFTSYGGSSAETANPGTLIRSSQVFDVNREQFNSQRSRWLVAVTANSAQAVKFVDVGTASEPDAGSPPVMSAGAPAQAASAPVAAAPVAATSTTPAPVAAAPVAATSTTPAVAVSTPAHPSFNCALAHTVVEGMICGSGELSAMDSKLASLYEAKLKTAAAPSVLRSDQLAWMRKRNACGANVNCLEQSYEERITQLQQ